MNPTRLKHLVTQDEKICRTYKNRNCKNQRIKSLQDNILADFKFTSQANHLSKLINLKTETERQDRHMQRLYKRRIRKEDGLIYSNWGILLKDSSIDGN